MSFNRSPDKRSFKVSNSILQGLTTTTAAELNRLPPFTMTALLGLLSLIDADRPTEEVRTRPTEILDVIEVSKQVATAVTREWVGPGDEPRRQTYTSRRHSPTHVQRLQKVLLELYNRSVVLHSPGGGATRTVHLLDMFGYAYEKGGRRLDPHHPPAGYRPVNVGNDKRPVWRLRHKTKGGEQDAVPRAVLFRLRSRARIT